MNKLFFALVTFFATGAFAGELKSIDTEQQQVPVSLVYDVQFADVGPLTANFTTVFRGSAAGISSVFVTLSESFEDDAFTFEFTNLIAQPTNIQVKASAANQYTITFDVSESVYDQDIGGFDADPKTITLVVTLDQEGALSSVEQK